MENQTVNNQAEKTDGLEKLLDNVKYAGFGTELHQAIREKVEDNVPEFTVGHSVDDAIYELHFKKSAEKDQTYFNKYDVTLLPNEKQPNELSQTFYYNQNITAKEAYNLLKGGSVYKTFNVYEKIGEGEAAQYKWTPETYKAWVKLDFEKQDKNGNYELKKYGEGYGFDLLEKLKEKNITELSNPEKLATMTRSLEKGNLTKATFTDEKGERKDVLLRVDVKYKDVVMYKPDGNRMYRSNSQKQGVTEKQDKAEKKTTAEKKPKQKKGPKL